MVINSNSHIAFYQTEIQTIENRWNLFLAKRVNQLIAEKELFIGSIIKYDSYTGLFHLRIRKDLVPRQYNNYFIGLIGSKAFSYGDPFNWSFTYKQFRESESNGLWGDRLGGEASTVRCYKIESNYAFFELSITDKKTATDFKTCLDQIDDPLVLITQSDPPLKYLINLYEFIKYSEGNALLELNIDYNIRDWKPNLIDNEHSISEYIDTWLESSDLIVIQGPPGTGKSYNVAEYCDKLLMQNKTVCISSLANKALIEITRQPGISRALKEEIVYKTNLTDDEKARTPLLKHYDGQLPTDGSLLLATYYKLSDIAKDLIRQNIRFDLVIIEEASQAFLATIAMFKSIAKKIVLVGDHMQLPPVVITNPDKLLRLHDKIYGIINGMATVAREFENHSYRLTKTRRLTKKAANQTGIFYDDTLISISKLIGQELHSEELRKLFDKEGGTSILKLPTADPNYDKKYIKRLIGNTVSKIIESGNFSIAILTQTRALEIELTQSLVNIDRGSNDITVSTVHKIQGITVDYTIVYLPLRNIMYEFGENFFNVATSRAKRGTLIITHEVLNLTVGIELSVRKFIEQSMPITIDELD